MEPEGAEVLAADLAHLDAGQYQLVAEWMLDHGWTEPLDPVVPRCKACNAAKVLICPYHGEWPDMEVTPAT